MRATRFRNCIICIRERGRASYLRRRCWLRCGAWRQGKRKRLRRGQVEESTVLVGPTFLTQSKFKTELDISIGSHTHRVKFLRNVNLYQRRRRRKCGTLEEEEGKLETDEARNWTDAMVLRIFWSLKKKKNSLMLCTKHALGWIFRPPKLPFSFLSCSASLRIEP